MGDMRSTDMVIHLYVWHDRFLYVGLAGRVDTFESLTNGFSLWMDMDPGTATGLRDLSKLNDDSGPAARLMSNTKVTLPTTYGAEYGLAVFRHSQLGSSPEDTLVGQPVLPPIIGAQAGLYQVQDAITSVLAPKQLAVAFQPRPNKTDPPKGAEIAIPLRQIYGSGVASGARIGFIGMLTSTGEAGTTLAASDVNRATLGGRPAPAAWLSNQIVPSQLNVSNDWGTNPITLIQSTNYNVKFASTASGIATKTRIVPTPRNSDLTTLEVTLLNTGTSLNGPLNLVASVPAGVELLNRTDMTLLTPVRPYIRVQSGSLAPGSSVTVTLRFRSATGFKPTFTLMSGEGVL